MTAGSERHILAAADPGHPGRVFRRDAAPALAPREPLVPGGVLVVHSASRVRGLKWRPDDRLLLDPGSPAQGQRPQKRGRSDRMERSRGERPIKIHALADAAGRPILRKLTAGQVRDGRLAVEMLAGVGPGQTLLANRGYGGDYLRILRGVRAARWPTSSRCPTAGGFRPSTGRSAGSAIWWNGSLTNSNCSERSPPATTRPAHTTSSSVAMSRRPVAGGSGSGASDARQLCANPPDRPCAMQKSRVNPAL